MADDSDEEEFERFLQEDDDSMSTSSMNIALKSKTNTKKQSGKSAQRAYTSSSSAAAVTASAASLLASFKLSQKDTKKKTKKKSSSNKKKRKDEEEESPPPSYSSARGTREDPTIDPYAFDLDSSYHLKDDSDNEQKRLKEKKQKKDAPAAAKKPMKSAVSLEERVAQILKRTGSSALPQTTLEEKEDDDDDEDDEEDTSNSISRELAKALPKSSKTEPTLSVAAAEQKQSKQEDDMDKDEDEYNNVKRLSMSDSLGMSSADFEVGVHAKRTFERSRLSLSSMNSDKFAVNVDALEESEMTTQFRYGQQRGSFLATDKSDQDGADEEYDDDDFELDQTTARDVEMASSRVSEPHEPTFVSQFDKMKEFFALDASLDAAKENHNRNIEESDPPVVNAASIDDTGTFGYDEDEFEADEPGTKEDEFPADVPPVKMSSEQSQQSREDESAEYGDENFEQEDVPSMKGSMAVDGTVADVYEQDVDLDILLARKYGDFYADLSENLPKQELASPIQEAPANSDASGGYTVIPSTITEAHEPPPSSPPPPPPPDDEPEGDDIDSFSLDPIPLRESPPRDDLLHSQSVVIKQPVPVWTQADRFHHLQSHVSSLRFISDPISVSAKVTTTVPKHIPAEEALLEPASQIVNELAEIDEFMRESSRLKDQRQRMHSLRSSTSRESELMFRLQQAQRQIIQLKSYIQSENNADHPDGIKKIQSQLNPASLPVYDGEKKSHHVDDSVVLSKEDYARLENEIKTQDHLIEAYQKENEQLMRQLKQITHDVQYDVHQQNEVLKAQLKQLREQLEASKVSPSVATVSGFDSHKSQYHAAVTARLEAEAYAMSLKEELANVRVTHQQKENELKVALEQVKKAKKELECRYEGVTMDKMAEESRYIQDLKSELEMRKKEYDHTLAGMQKKIDWYVENQRLLDDQDDEIQRLKDQIAQLSSETNRLQSKPGQWKGTRPASATSPSQSSMKHVRYHRSAADIRRIQELESRLLEMEEAMRKRHPDSVVNLILASRKAEEESKTKALEMEYERKLHAIEEEMEQLHVNNQRKLESFRQQQEKLVHQYHKRIQELEMMLEKRDLRPYTQKRPHQRHTGTHDVNPEEELKRVRKFYTDKIKEVERKWEMKYRSLRKQQYGAVNNGNQDQLNPSYADATIIIGNLQRQLRENEAEVKKLKATLHNQEQLETTKHYSTVSGATDPTTNRSHGLVEDELIERNASLEAQLRASEDARAHLVQTLCTLESLNKMTTTSQADKSLENQTRHAVQDLVEESDKRAKMEKEQLIADYNSNMESIRQKYETKLAAAKEKTIALEQKLIEQSTSLQNAQAQITDNLKEIQHLQGLTHELAKEKRSLQDLVDQIPLLEDEVSRLQEQLTIPQTPSMLQYRSLELKVETLTQKHQLREAELKVLLNQAMQSSQLEKLNMERIHQNAIALKNAEILKFKKQLEEILKELEQLRGPTESVSP